MDAPKAPPPAPPRARGEGKGAAPRVRLVSAPLKALPAWADVALIPLLNVAAAFLISGLVVLAIGEDPIEAVKILIAGALGDLEGLGFTLYYATSFIFTGLAVAICFHAGLFNIGVEGQAYVAGLGAALAALYLGPFLPGYSLVIVAILAAALFGAAFAAIPGYLQAKRDSHIVITTIMFNYIASALMGYLLVDVLRSPTQMNAETPQFPPGGIVPQFHELLKPLGIEWPVTPFNLSFLLALAAAAGVWLLIWRTRLGYEIRTVGANAQAGFVFDPEIIAGQLIAWLAPPLHRHPLGALGADHGVGGAPPDETGRGTVRHLRDDFDLFRPLEQPQRPQRRLALCARRPGGLGRRDDAAPARHHRALRNMGVLRQMHDHAFAADPRGDAVDQSGQFVIVVHIGIEIALLLHDDFGAAGGQANEIEAETGIERIGEGIEPLAKQPVDDTGAGHAVSGVDCDGADRAVGAEETQFQPPRALALPLHRHDKRAGRGRPGLPGSPRPWPPVRQSVFRRYSPAAVARIDRRIALPQRLFQQVVKAAPNRAVISARSREATSPMVLSPARRRPPITASSAPSANSGSGFIASASSPSSDDAWPGRQRASARAQAGVPAIAAVTIKPCRCSVSAATVAAAGVRFQ